MKKIYAGLLSGLLILTALSSCDKQETVDVTKTGYLYNRGWQIIGLRSTSNVDVEEPIWVNLYDAMDPCKKDDYYFFSTKSSGAVYDHFIKCALSDPDSVQFWFSVSEDDQFIKVYSNPEDVEGSILVQGKITTPHIDTFKVNHRYWNPTTELNEEIEFTFKHFVPTDF